MSSDDKKAHVGATVTSVNGKSSSAIWVRGDDIGAPGATYPDGSANPSALGCVKAGTNIVIAADGTISASGTIGTDWTAVSNKPFKTIGKNLSVDANGALNASGSGPSGPVDWADITNKPASFPPPVASAATLGGVKQGTNITIAADGTISATGSLGTDWSNITNKPTQFPPTPANGSTTLGGVKAGTNITIAADGTISASGGGSTDWSQITNKPATFTPPTATASVMGGVKVGAGINVQPDGTISVNSSAPTWDQILNKPATFIPPIASEKQLGGVKEGPGINIAPDGTITTVATAPTWDEIQDKPATFEPPIASSTVLGGVKAGNGVTAGPDGTISVRTTPPDWSEITDKPSTYNPPIASASVLGGVKQGANISIEPDGTISAGAIDIPIASQFTLGAIKVGNGLTIQEDGTLGTEASAPYWTEIVGKPDAFPPTNAQEGVVGGIMPDNNFTVNESGLLSAKPFKGKAFAVVNYDDDGNIVGSTTMQNKNGNLILGGNAYAVNEAGVKEEVSFGGALTLLDKTQTYSSVISNDSFDYDIALSNGPNIKPKFLPFVTEVVGTSLKLAFGSMVDAIGYATTKTLGLVEVGKNIDVDSKGIISVKTADKSQLGVVIAGDHINVNSGVITPAIATYESPGIVQVGQGLEVDANGVLSALNPIAFVNSKLDFNTDKKLAKSGSFDVPEGVDYFRVTLWGCGGNGGQSGGDAEKWAGGGGGGGGAWYQFIVYAYLFDSKKFTYALGAPTGTWSQYTGSTIFFDGEGKAQCIVGGGQNGQSADSGLPADNGFAMGGLGGYVATFLPKSGKFAAERWASGGDGGTGFRIATTKNSSAHKSMGGVGGTSGGGSGVTGTARDNHGFGGGSHGGGDNYPNGMCDPGYSAILIEW